MFLNFDFDFFLNTPDILPGFYRTRKDTLKMLFLFIW